MTRLSSAKYLRGSRGQQCTLRIPGVCNNDPATVVAAHIRDGHKGGGTKASDISVLNACHSCHMVFDGQAKMPSGDVIPHDVWCFYALRGLQETLEQRIDAGLLIFPHDATKEHVPKPRKPKSERKAINSRPFPKQSRGWRKIEE